MRYLLIVTLLAIGYGENFAQKNMELLSQVTYNQRLSDIWGYTDSVGNEYALVCLRSGVAIENITDPSNPQRVAIIESPTSTWRDAKTFGHYAYFTNESNSGVQIINLKNLPNPPDSSDVYFWEPVLFESDTLSACHNLYIDESTGYGFLAGCSNRAGRRINNGAVLLIDLFSTPGNPQYVSSGPSVYAHDVYARGNFIYSSDISRGSFGIHDFSDPNTIVTISTQNSPFSFTHNAWLSDDGTTIFTTDERRNAPIGAYDISDKTNIKYLDEFRPISSINTNLIPHNVHVKNDFLITSYYTEGVIITDGNKPDNLIEVGNYDTFSGGNGGFDGVWGAFPFFNSGTVIASDIGTGLYIFKPTYTRACYLEGFVKDALTGNSLDSVMVRIQSNDANFAVSGISGDYKTGQVTAGSFEVIYSKEGYESKTITVTLENGLVTPMDVDLFPLATTSIPQLEGVENFSASPNPFKDNVTIHYSLSNPKLEMVIVVNDILGRPVYQTSATNQRGSITLGDELGNGIYFIHLASKGVNSDVLKVIKSN